MNRRAQNEFNIRKKRRLGGSHGVFAAKVRSIEIKKLRPPKLYVLPRDTQSRLRGDLRVLLVFPAERGGEGHREQVWKGVNETRAKQHGFWCDRAKDGSKIWPKFRTQQLRYMSCTQESGFDRTTLRLKQAERSP